MESRLSKEKIQSELDRMGISYPEIKLYGITDSTNLQAVALGQAGGGDAIFIAEEQTAGKGRRGRSFTSRGGVGIYISFLTHPSAAAECAVGITAYTAVKMCRAIESMTGGEIKIKWVNDLYSGGKKLAGILTEGAFDSEGKLSFAVVGIGVNVLKCDLGEELNAIATSVEEGFGIQLDRNVLTARMIAEFLTGYGNFDDDAIVDEYIRRSFLIGKDITVHKLSESYPATVKAINRDYSLLVDRDGKEERIFTGEVSVRER